MTAYGAYGFRALYPVVWIGSKNGVGLSFGGILAICQFHLERWPVQKAIGDGGFGHQRRVSQVEG